MVKGLRITPFIAVILLISSACFSANPPICPHVIGWNGQIDSWAKGAPWIKVIFQTDIAPAQAAGAKVFYRPYDADSTYHDDGQLPASRTGSQYADLVWNKIKNMTKKPDAVSYRNEFNWGDPTASKRTCAEFVNYKNRLRALGYTGKIIFGSFGVGWVDADIWNDPDLMAAVNAADGVETHEYFDLQVNCCAPWLCFRHRDIAIAQHPYLQNKEWYIGEFGSDRVCGHCPSCDDPQCRSGWQDNGKLTAQQMIDQMKIYRAGCADQVVAVFVFQQGAPNWAAFETMGTPVADYMKSTWAAVPGTLTGTVKSSSGANLSGVTVTTSSGGYTAQTGTNGVYTIGNVAPGTYDLTAVKSGYGAQTQTGKVVNSGQSLTVNFTLTPVTPTGGAKSLPERSSALVTGIVTATFPVTGSQQRAYIEDPDRTSGIAVVTTKAVSQGDQIQAQGTVATTGGERLLNAAAVTTLSSGNPIPRMIGLTNLQLGGGQFGYQPALLNSAPDVYAEGPNNVGLLVRSWGKVGYVDPLGGYFYMDDGSDIHDGSGQVGIKVACAGLETPANGENVTITGVSGTALVNNKPVRLLRPRSTSDLSYSTDVNYLLNPGFETGTLANWTAYGSIDGLQTGSWFGGITPHSGAWFLGSAANGGTKNGGIYQRISIASGTRCSAKAWSRVYRGGNAADAAQNRVGLDPTGGTDPSSPSVQWSAADTQPTDYYSEWHQLTTPTVTAAGGYVTVFLDMKQTDGASWKINCFDDAGLYHTP